MDGRIRRQSIQANFDLWMGDNCGWLVFEWETTIRSMHSTCTAEKVEPGGVPQCMHKKICIQKKHNLFGNWEEGVCYTFMNVQGRGGK